MLESYGVPTVLGERREHRKEQRREHQKKMQPPEMMPAQILPTTCFKEEVI